MSKFKRKSLSKANEELNKANGLNVSLISADNFHHHNKDSHTPTSPNNSYISAVSDGDDVVEGFQYDFALILPNPEHHDYREKNFVPEMTLDEIVERLQIGGLQTYVYRAVDNEEFIVKCRVPLQRLKDFAEEIEFDVKVDERYLEEVVDNGNCRIGHDPRKFHISLVLVIGNVSVIANSDITELFPYEHIYANYKKGDFSRNCINDVELAVVLTCRWN